MPRLIWVFARRTSHFAGFVVLKTLQGKKQDNFHTGQTGRVASDLYLPSKTYHPLESTENGNRIASNEASKNSLIFPWPNFIFPSPKYWHFVAFFSSCRQGWQKSGKFSYFPGQQAILEIPGQYWEVAADKWQLQFSRILKCTYPTVQIKNMLF